MKNMNFPRTGELHRRAGPSGCTTRRASGLRKRAGRRAAEKSGPEGCGKERAGGLPFSADRAALLSSVQPAESSRFSFGNTALQLVLSPAGAHVRLLYASAAILVTNGNTQVLHSTLWWSSGFFSQRISALVASQLQHRAWSSALHQQRIPRILFGRGHSITSSVTDVFLTVETWYRAPVQILASLFRGKGEWPLRPHSGCATALHLCITEHETGQVASTVSQVFGVTQPGIEPIPQSSVARALYPVFQPRCATARYPQTICHQTKSHFRALPRF